MGRAGWEGHIFNRRGDGPCQRDGVFHQGAVGRVAPLAQLVGHLVRARRHGASHVDGARVRVQGDARWPGAAGGNGGVAAGAQGGLLAVDFVVGRYVGDRRLGRAGWEGHIFNRRGDVVDWRRDGRCAMCLCRSRFRAGVVAAAGDASRVEDVRARCRCRGRHGDGKAQAVARRQHGVRGTGDYSSVGRTAGGQGADGQVQRDLVRNSDGAAAGG